MKNQDLHFLLRRLHGLSGIVPIGAFLLEHLFTNSKITVGAAEWTEGAMAIQHLPFLWVMEIGFIALPIAFHAGYGFYIWYEGRGNATEYPFLRNWFYTLQRVTGLLVFAYIVYHVYHTRINWLLNDVYPGARYMHDYLAQGLNPTIYRLGIAAAAFHFANGLWNVSCKWGITVTPQAQRLAGYACAALGAALLVAGVASINTFINLPEEELQKADQIERAAAMNTPAKRETLAGRVEFPR